MKNIVIWFAFLFIPYFIKAQELNARVQVLAPQVSNLNKSSLEFLQNSIRSYLNNNRFSSENYLPQERIDCNFVITVNAFDGGSNYTAEAQIQSSRPIYNSSYNTTLLNITDKDFNFSYQEGQSLDFIEQQFSSQLAAVLSFYAYTIIGLDQDSFGALAGTPYYQKAQNIVNLAQGSNNKGWTANEGLKNRYWLNENALNPAFEALRSFIYTYHRKGMDQLSIQKEKALSEIVNALPQLASLKNQKMGAVFLNSYFSTKAQEISQVLSLAPSNEKNKAFQLLSDIDPANISKYEAIKLSP